MKYIITKFNDVMIFNDALTHRQAALQMGWMDCLKSAGFCRFNHKGEASAYGSSLSLLIESHEEDSWIIQRAFGQDTF
jgi:hypothetical protein